MEYYYRCVIKREIFTRPKKVIHRTGSDTLGLYSPCCMELTSSGLPDSYTEKALNSYIKCNQVLELCTKNKWEF